jgi:chromatin segregation and condensation protein Rec8/ScpA/Scc1 (kleisin family)
VSLEAAPVAYDPELLGEAIGGLLRIPPEPDTSHLRPTVSLDRRLRVLRQLLGRRKRISFDETFGDEDRLTQAVTLVALLEMHRRGEATWDPPEVLGPIEIIRK